MPVFGPQLERLEAVAAGRKYVAIGGKRDAGTSSSIHLLPPAYATDGKGTLSEIPVDGSVHALAFVSDDLLVAGRAVGGGGRITGFDASRAPGEVAAALFDVDTGAAVRALAIDAGGTMLAAACADGSLHLFKIAITDARPRLDRVARRALTDSALTAVAFDPAGLVVAGGTGGGVWTILVSE